MLLEKISQQRVGFIGQHPTEDIHTVIQSGKPEHVDQASGGAEGLIFSGRRLTERSALVPMRTR